MKYQSLEELRSSRPRLADQSFPIEHHGIDFANPEDLRRLAGIIEKVLDSGQYERISFEAPEGIEYFGVRDETEEDYEKRTEAEWDFSVRWDAADRAEAEAVKGFLARHPEMEFSKQHLSTKFPIGKWVWDRDNEWVYPYHNVDGISVYGYFYINGSGVRQNLGTIDERCFSGNPEPGDVYGSPFGNEYLDV
jgi:hypothetical protein